MEPWRQGASDTMRGMTSEAKSLPLPSLDCGVALLRPWCMDDLDALVASANDESVSRGQRGRFPYPYAGDDGHAWLARAVGTPERAWAIVVDGGAVGGVSLHPDAGTQGRSAELSYWLAQRLWNRGVMTKIIAAFAPRAVEAFGLARLHAGVYESNPASMRVLEKGGFEHDGVQKSAVLENGRPLDIHVYAWRRPAA